MIEAKGSRGGGGFGETGGGDGQPPPDPNVKVCGGFLGCSDQGVALYVCMYQKSRPTLDKTCLVHFLSHFPLVWRRRVGHEATGRTVLRHHRRHQQGPEVSQQEPVKDRVKNELRKSIQDRIAKIQSDIYFMNY
ncbi:hypothetical protein DdX_18151 [Ditylenchus destructor]|uniref:Uncharacterized protein n=1 Tax=Ditylenchus destructor TaxID=166010 RepID=A0AAD4MM51_9BILA|nr:hypothetical protein DdX_18151 [Ditylenchus destructor]